MKTEEDEAFEDIERRQGGFQAKREAALDRLVQEQERLGLYDPAPPLAQEPVAWQWLGSAHFRKKLPKNADITAWNPLYTTPPQREWVGLTDADIADCMEMSIQKTCYAIEAKLKEKNT